MEVEEKEPPSSISDLEGLAIFVEDKIREIKKKSSLTKELRYRGETQLSKETKILIEQRRFLLKIRKIWKRDGRYDEFLIKVLNHMNKDIKKNIKKDIDLKDSKRAANLLEEIDPKNGGNYSNRYAEKGSL